MRVSCIVPLGRIQDHAIGIECMMSLVAQLMNLSANVASTELCHQCGLTVLAVVGWVVFIGGFATFNAQTK